jgi:hypothetical protein
LQGDDAVHIFGRGAPDHIGTGGATRRTHQRKFASQGWT